MSESLEQAMKELRLVPGSPIFADGRMGRVILVSEQHAMVDFGDGWKVARIPVAEIKLLPAGAVDRKWVEPT